MSDKIKKEFWDRMEDTRVGMLSADGARAVPMSHYIDEDGPRNVVWFITSKDTDLGKAAEGGAEAQYIVCSSNEHLHARVDGRITISHDKAELDRIWNAVASAWFDGGERDPDVRLVRLDLAQAEVWVTGGSMKFLYEVVKANTSDAKPDMGERATLRF